MKLVYIEYMGDSIALPMGESLLGRDAGCTFRFQDPAVSRRHARFIHRHDEVFIEDLGSANGTLLNGRTVIAPIRIRHGDVITVGSRDLRVSVTAAVEEEDTTTVRVLARAAQSPSRGARMGRATTEMPAVMPPPLEASDRCPRCSAVVNAADGTCGNCQYTWGSEPLSAATSLNRRRYERCFVELDVAYESDARQAKATTLDLSENGVFVCTSAIDPVGTRCTLTLEVEGGSLVVDGVVARVVEPGSAHPELVGMGIELVAVGASEQAWLARVVERLTMDTGH